MREDENSQVWLRYALSNFAVDTRYPIEIGEQPDENDYKIPDIPKNNPNIDIQSFIPPKVYISHRIF